MKFLTLLVTALLFVGCGSNSGSSLSGSPNLPTEDTAVEGGGNHALESGETAVNTRYCQVDSLGQVVTDVDFLEVSQEDSNHPDRVLGRGGGCVQRGIREVWAVVFNHDSLKAEDVDSYEPGPLLPTNFAVGEVFNYHIWSEAGPFFYRVRWRTHWVHTVTRGTYEEPEQVSIRFWMEESNRGISFCSENYILDRVTSSVTSFYMRQEVEAIRVDTHRVKENIERILGVMRSSTPNWEALPERSEHIRVP